MAKTKKKLSKEEKLAKDRLRKQKKYQEIKNNPELYEIQKEKDRMRYLLKKEEKKICSINEMSKRDQRDLRKRWRKNSLKYLKKKKEQKVPENILINNSPPESETENVAEVPNNNNQDPLALEHESDAREKNIRRRRETISSSVLRKTRYRAAKTIKTLQTEIEKLKKEKDMYRQRTQQLQKKVKEQKSKEDTLEKKVDSLIHDIKNDKIEQVKKKLLFDEHLSRTVKNTYENLQKKDKRSFIDNVLPKSHLLEKHKIRTKVPFSVRQKLAENRNNTTQKKKHEIQAFYEEDVNSRVAAGKKEFVKKRGEKKQKRYLNDNLKNLHDKFCKEHESVSYAVFCKYRPFWVVFPNNERDTCQCHLHANVNLLIKALHKSKIISEASTTEVLNKLCCDSYNDKCLTRACEACLTKTLNYSEFNNDINLNYFEWERVKTEKVGKGQNKTNIITDKTKKQDSPRNIIHKLESILPVFMKHTRNIVVQYSAIKLLKENLSEDEIIIHVDFSENYSLKYNEEVQSFHFGASRSHVSLHTVVMYYMDAIKGLTSKSICTISSCLNHDATAIWSHIKPLLEIAKQLVPALAKVHFLSDSPSCQYRNRFIFYMLTKIHLQVPTITTVTWNYHESGHGKGAPDGVGSTLKRTADNYVKYGGDIGSFEDFADLVTKTIKNIEIVTVQKEDIESKKFPKTVPSFKGTTLVHQALWSTELPYSVIFRELSCFMCLNSFLICTHQKHLGVLSTGFGPETNDLESSVQLDLLGDFNEDNLSPLHLDSVLDSDNLAALDFSLDTFSNEIDGTHSLNNIPLLDKQPDDVQEQVNNNEDEMFLNEIDGTLSWNNIPLLDKQLDDVQEQVNNNEDEMFLNEIDGTLSWNNIPLLDKQLDDVPEQKKIRVVSDIRIDTQRYQGRKRKHEDGVKDLETTLRSNIIQKYEYIKDKIVKDATDETKPKKGTNQKLTKVFLNHLNRIEFENKEWVPNDIESADKSFDEDYYTTSSINPDKNDKENTWSEKTELTHYNLDDWVVVKYVAGQNRISSLYFIGKIMDRFDKNEYKIAFLKRAQGKSTRFAWPPRSDEDVVQASQIVKPLTQPTESRRGLFSFTGLPNFNFE